MVSVWKISGATRCANCCGSDVASTPPPPRYCELKVLFDVASMLQVLTRHHVALVFLIARTSYSHAARLLRSLSCSAGCPSRPTAPQGDDGLDNPRHELRQPAICGVQRGHLHAGSDGELPVDAAHPRGVRHDPSAHAIVPLGAYDHVVGEASGREGEGVECCRLCPLLRAGIV